MDDFGEGFVQKNPVSRDAGDRATRKAQKPGFYYIFSFCIKNLSKKPGFSFSIKNLSKKPGFKGGGRSLQNHPFCRNQLSSVNLPLNMDNF